MKYAEFAQLHHKWCLKCV